LFVIGFYLVSQYFPFNGFSGGPSFPNRPNSLIRLSAARVVWLLGTPLPIALQRSAANHATDMDILNGPVC
jgi:hypothetical protein